MECLVNKQSKYQRGSISMDNIGAETLLKKTYENTEELIKKYRLLNPHLLGVISRLELIVSEISSGNKKAIEGDIKSRVLYNCFCYITEQGYNSSFLVISAVEGNLIYFVDAPESAGFGIKCVDADNFTSFSGVNWSKDSIAECESIPEAIKINEEQGVYPLIYDRIYGWKKEGAICLKSFI